MPYKDRPSVAVNGDALRAARVRAGISRKNLALAAQLSYGHLAGLETLPSKRASPELLHRLARVLEVEASTLARNPAAAVVGDAAVAS